MDATIVPVPIQRNSREENKSIKEGEIPADWLNNANKLAQKDTDARWTKKKDVSYFGYKDPITIDVKYGFIRCYSMTNASVHDSQALSPIFFPKLC